MLDGIRGLAILAVLCHHFVIFSGMALDNAFDDAFYRVGMSSWLGVDLFFVLSGFLITGILYDAKDSKGYFRNFYGRRVLRIFPLYYAFLTATFLLGPLLLGRERFAPLLEDQFWYWTYLTNMEIAVEGWSKPMHLEHFWSLAVEEQFYLLWPLAVYALDRRRLLRLSVACFGLAIGLRFVVPLWLDPVANYVLMPTRLDALGAGAFVALALRGPGGLTAFGAWPRRVLLGSIVFTAAIGFWKGEIYELDPVVRTVGFSIFAAGFAALIAVSLGTTTGATLRRVLSSRLLAILAKYSYALYVLHHPIALLLRNVGFDAGSVARVWGSQLAGVVAFGSVAALLSAVAAFASWHLLEAPCLGLRRYVEPAGAAPSISLQSPKQAAPTPVIVASGPVDPASGLLTYVPQARAMMEPPVARQKRS